MTAPESDQPVAVVTGASSGIGEATAKTLAGLGFHVVCVARREDRIKALADEIGGTAIVADVTDGAAVEALAAGAGPRRRAGQQRGRRQGPEPVADADLDDWRWMWETNVLGTLRVTRALLPKLIDSGDGLIVTITSIAAFEIYDGGAGYTSAKHAQAALHQTLRGELLGKPVRLTEIAPGMVETEFSLVRFDGDQERADAVYEGMTPLVGRGRRRGDRVRRVAAVARQPGPDRHPAARSGQRDAEVHPPGADRRPGSGGRRRRRPRQRGGVGGRRRARCSGCSTAACRRSAPTWTSTRPSPTAQSQMSPSA